MTQAWLILREFLLALSKQSVKHLQVIHWLTQSKTVNINTDLVIDKICLFLSLSKTLLQAPSITFPPHISLKSLTWFHAHLHRTLSVIWVPGFAFMHRRQCFLSIISFTCASRAFLSVYWQRQAKAGVKICPFSITIIYQPPPISRIFLSKQTKELLPAIL